MSLSNPIVRYVPKPRPGVFRVTKDNHNILQGIARPEERLTSANKQLLIVDDPQMPGLIPLAKEAAPDRPIIFRSHIQIRSDLIEEGGTPQAESWDFIWNHVKLSDCIISHPVSAFVPKDVPPEIVGYMPASTDWYVVS
jgi:hypothetical protein